MSINIQHYKTTNKVTKSIEFTISVGKMWAKTKKFTHDLGITSGDPKGWSRENETSLRSFILLLLQCFQARLEPFHKIKIPLAGHSFSLAESEGFEPSIRFPVYTLSRRAPSTTRTTLQFLGRQRYTLHSLF